jgi:RNA polymerase sigma-70 factor, ECF subfamily
LVERRLVERAMEGDEAAFDALVGRVGDQLHSVARRILRDPYLAEDAMQRALLDAWRFLPRLRDPERFEAWAYKLVVHACYMEARRERHHRGNLRLLGFDVPGAPDPAANLSLSHQLDQAFGALGIEHRTVVVLVHYVGFTPAEAATAMGTPIGTVRSRLHYALKHLRAALEADARDERVTGTA